MSSWMVAGWTRRFLVKSPSREWVFRKAFVDNVLATLQLEVICSFDGIGRVVVVGMDSSNMIRRDKDLVIRKAIMDAARKALHHLGVANPNQSLYDFQGDLLSKFSYSVSRWNVRYNVRDVNIKRINRRGKYYNVATDARGRFLSTTRYFQHGSSHFDDRDVDFTPVR